MAKIGRRRLARELVRLLSEQPSQRTELLQQVAAYLITTKQTTQAHLLVSDIADELLTQQKHLSADVQSAFGLGQGSRQHIIELLQRATGAKSVELHETTNQQLIGGVVVRTAQLELDASIKRRLNQLAGGLQ